MIPLGVAKSRRASAVRGPDGFRGAASAGPQSKLGAASGRTAEQTARGRFGLRLRLTITQAKPSQRGP
jgi:hypothetical protein